MRVSDVLREKGGHVLTIDPHASLEQVIRMLVDQNIGSLVVVDPVESSRIVGIITERDILRASAARVGVFTDRLVSDVMTPNPLTGSPTDEVTVVMGLMTDRRIRHLPIVGEERLIGIVSLGDLVKAQNHRISMENQVLKSYIQS
jgi:CBS domain-containing protein